MKFLIYGDEERFLQDRIKELNRNFSKETRVRLLRTEVKKREKILRRRWKRYRYLAEVKYKYFTILKMINLISRRQKNLSRKAKSVHKDENKEDLCEDLMESNDELIDFEEDVCPPTREDEDDTGEVGENLNSILFFLSEDKYNDKSGNSETDNEDENDDLPSSSKTNPEANNGNTSSGLRSYSAKPPHDSAVGGSVY